MKFGKGIISRSSIKKLYLKIVKQLCWSLFLNKNADLQSWDFIKKRLQHSCFPVNIVKYLRTTVLKNIYEWLFKRFPIWANNKQHRKWGRHFLKNKTKKKHSKTQLNENNLLFHDALDHFLFLYISTACLRQHLPYIIKDDSSEGL